MEETFDDSIILAALDAYKNLKLEIVGKNKDKFKFSANNGAKSHFVYDISFSSLPEDTTDKLKKFVGDINHKKWDKAMRK